MTTGSVPPGRNPYLVLVAGVVNVRIARGVGTFRKRPASSVVDNGGISVRLSGTGWTLTRTLEQLGTDVAFATYVGTDELGNLVAQQLAQYGHLGATALRCDSQPRAMVLYDRHGRRANVTDLRSTPDLRYPAHVVQPMLDAGCEAALLTNIGFTRSLLPSVIDRGIPVITDLHLVESADCEYNRDWMRAAHVLACSHERLPTNPESWIRETWRRFGTSITLVGCGPGGVVVGDRRSRRIWRVESCAPRGVRYVSGAGDTFLASFVHHYLRLGDAVAATRNAVLAAGWKVGGHPDEDVGVPRERLARLRATHGLPGATQLR